MAIRGFRLVLLALVALLLSACSRTEIVYNNADWLIYRWADGLLDAEDDQAERWRALFGRVLAQHRRDLLPDVVTLLHRVSTQTRSGLTPGGLDCVAQATEDLVDAHARLAVEPAVAILGDLSPAQIRHLEAELHERNREYRERFLHPDPGRRAEARVERFAARIERWTGDLSTAQLRVVQEAVGDMPDLAGVWLDYRERQQRRLIALLRREADPAQLRAFLDDWWVQRRDRDVRLRDSYAQVRDATLRLILTLEDDLDAEQRAHFQRTASGMRDDLAGLIEGRFDVASIGRVDDACVPRPIGPG